MTKHNDITIWPKYCSLKKQHTLLYPEEIKDGYVLRICKSCENEFCLICENLIKPSQIFLSVSNMPCCNDCLRKNAEVEILSLYAYTMYKTYIRTKNLEDINSLNEEIL